MSGGNLITALGEMAGHIDAMTRRSLAMRSTIAESGRLGRDMTEDCPKQRLQHYAPLRFPVRELGTECGWGHVRLSPTCGHRRAGPL
jgi:hypothetical protein